MTVYLFGEFCNGYTQYPDDESSKVFQKLLSVVKANTQIVIRRDGNLMYYAYIRKLSERQYCGMCIVEAGRYYTNVNRLFPVFEECIEQMAYRGRIIHFDSNGNLATQVNKLYQQAQDVFFACSCLSSSLRGIVQLLQQLPPVNYSVSPYSVNYCSSDDKPDAIAYSSYTFGTTVVLKDKDYNTVQYNSYRSVLGRLSACNQSLTAENARLQKEKRQILRQKKQIKTVIFLALIVAFCAWWIVGLCGRIDSVRKSLDYSDDMISALKDSIMLKANSLLNMQAKVDSMYGEILCLNENIDAERARRERVDSNFCSFKESVSSSFPILVTNIEIANIYKDGRIETGYGYSIESSRSMFLCPKITYTGIRTGEDITLYYKLYDEYGELFRVNSAPEGYSMGGKTYVYSGSGNTYAFLGIGVEDKGHWRKGKYKCEIWYADKCLMSKTFIIN